MTDRYPKLRVAAVQAAPVLLNRDATVEKACHLIQQAGEAGAQVVVFPECFIPGFPSWFAFYPAAHPQCQRFNRELFKNAVEIPSPATRKLAQAAQKANTYVVIGLHERRPGMMGTLYNSQLFLHRDGSTLRVFPTEFGALGGLICGENGNPLFRFALACQGEVIHAASWPSYAGRQGTGYSRDARDAMLLRMRNYAWEGKLFVASAAEIFTEEMAQVLELDKDVWQGMKEKGGFSAILGPWGEFLAGPSPEGEAIVCADIDLEMLIDARMLQDFTGHYNRFDVVSLCYNPAPYTPVRSPLPPVLDQKPKEASSAWNRKTPLLGIEPFPETEETSQDTPQGSP